MNSAERERHIEGEAAFKATVLNEFKNAKDQRKEDKKDINKRIDDMKVKHTDTYKDVFTLIGKNATQIATMVERVDGVKEDIQLDVKTSIGNLETDVKKVGRKSGTYAGVISSVSLKVIEKGLKLIGIDI